MLKKIILLMVVTLLFGCSEDQPTDSIVKLTKAAENIPADTEHLLVFFIDPNGRPCQVQADILTQMSADLDSKVLVMPVQTTVPADRDIFYAYGIRSLPTLLLADVAGKEIRRLPPGVHAAAAILELVNQIPKG